MLYVVGAGARFAVDMKMPGKALIAWAPRRKSPASAADSPEDVEPQGRARSDALLGCEDDVQDRTCKYQNQQDRCRIL